MYPSTIGGINKLDEAEKRAIYARYIPQDLIQKFNLPDLANNRDLLQFRFASGTSDVEMRLYHLAGFQDPILYAHLTDTMNGQIHDRPPASRAAFRSVDCTGQSCSRPTRRRGVPRASSYGCPSVSSRLSRKSTYGRRTCPLVCGSTPILR